MTAPKAPVTARTLAKRAATKAKNRRADAALIRTVGAFETILLARDEEAAVRRASVALGLPAEPDDYLYAIAERDPAAASSGLAAWYRLHVDPVLSSLTPEAYAAREQVAS